MTIIGVIILAQHQFLRVLNEHDQLVSLRTSGSVNGLSQNDGCAIEADHVRIKLLKIGAEPDEPSPS